MVDGGMGAAAEKREADLRQREEEARNKRYRIAETEAHRIDNEQIRLLEEELDYARKDAEALRGVGAKLSIAESVIESLRLGLVRFRCYLCKYEHYDKVDSFACPNCGEESTGSKHFSSAGHQEVLEILARYKDA